MNEAPATFMILLFTIIYRSSQCWFLRVYLDIFNMIRQFLVGDERKILNLNKIIYFSYAILRTYLFNPSHMRIVRRFHGFLQHFQK